MSYIDVYSFMNLCKNRIDIWDFSLKTPPTPSELALLNSEEQTRAKRYYFERHQRRFAVARITLRKIIAHYLQIAPESLKFGAHHHGKPFLLGSSTPLQFNLSHSEERALLAIGHTHALGVDLEFFSGRSYEGMGKQVFSYQENEILKTLPPRDKPLFFFKIWAQKEAYIIAIGEGLSYPVDKLTAPHLTNNKQILFKDPIYHQTWQMKSFMPTVACSAALCCHPSIEEIKYQKLNALKE